MVARESAACTGQSNPADGPYALELARSTGGSIESVLSSAQEFRKDVDLFANVDERKAQLQQELKSASAELRAAAAGLTSGFGSGYFIFIYSRLRRCPGCFCA